MAGCSASRPFSDRMPRTNLFMSALLSAAVVAGMTSCKSRYSETAPAPPPAPSVESSSLPSRPANRPPLQKLSAGKVARQVHDRINQERRRQGLPTFRWDSSLGRIAGAHSKDMAQRNFFGHTSPEGKGPAERYLGSGYACGITIDGVLRRGAEIIYRASVAGTPAGATGGVSGRAGITDPAIIEWKENAEDRKNILSPYWQREGVGVFIGPDGVMYITVNFC
jgi:uncharacterized protein YkwD